MHELMLRLACGSMPQLYKNTERICVCVQDPMTGTGDMASGLEDRAVISLSAVIRALTCQNISVQADTLKFAEY